MPVTARVEALRIETLPPFLWATKTEPPSGEIAMPSGSSPTGIGAPDTEFVAVAITEMVSSPELATQAVCPSGATAIPRGFEPTGMVPTTEFVAVLMTETVPSVSSVT